MKNFKLLFRLLIFLILFISCEPDDNYYSLSDEAKELLLFEEGGTFKLKNETTKETVLLKIISKTISYEQASKQISHISFGSSGDNFYETGTIIFTDENNCNGIISVTAERNDEFEFQIYLYGCFDESVYQEREYLREVIVNGIEYQDVYLLKYWPNQLYYSKSNGILKIENELNQKVKYSIIK